MLPDNIPEKLSFDYEFIEKIGEGANGETWLAQHRFTRVKAAIKCLKTDKIDDLKTLELFNRESELLKSVKVDGVPQFYDYYPPKDGGNGYLVQEYIQAPSIQTMIDNGEVFSESRALAIGERIATILYNLETDYQPPIIHRDIKPSNILYREADGMPYLIDFGSVANPQKRSGGSTVAGTFGYMPPEQIMGNVVIQSDYYALGATILHMITGVPPYKMDSKEFNIDIKGAFNDRHIKPSKRIIHLLAVLLSPEIEKRPKNALELINQIQIARGVKSVQHHSRFSLIKILKSLIGWILPIGMRSNAVADYAEDSGKEGLLTIRELERKLAEGEVLATDSCKFYIKNWAQCDGILRKKTFILVAKFKGATNYDTEYDRIDGVEYTFEVYGFMWDGFCRGVDTGITYPRKCSVLYNPRDPRMNALEFIYDSSCSVR